MEFDENELLGIIGYHELCQDKVANVQPEVLHFCFFCIFWSCIVHTQVCDEQKMFSLGKHQGL